MKIAIITISALIAAYVAFIAAPGIFAYFAVFARRKTVGMEELAATPYFKPYIEKIEAAVERLKGLNGKTVYINGFKNTPLCGLYIDNGSEKTAVLFHGYHAEPLVNFGVQASFLYDKGFNLLLPSQRGHGESGGKSTLGIYEKNDLLAWLDWVKTQTHAKEALVYGMSMGCFAAESASAEFDPSFVKAAVYDCGFLSPYSQLCFDLKKRHFPSAPVVAWTRLVVRFALGEDMKKSAKKPLSESGIPSLFLHGTRDGTVPFSDGKNNYEACAAEKKMYAVEGAHHTAAFLAGGREAEMIFEKFIISRF